MDQEHEQAARTRGYQLWQESGSTHGHDREDWGRAEREIQIADEGAQSIISRRNGEEQRGGVIVFHWTPVGLFYTMAQVWIETGRTLAGMIVWPGLQSRNDEPPPVVSDATDKAI